VNFDPANSQPYTRHLCLGRPFHGLDLEATAFGGPCVTGYVINVSATTPSPDEFEAERSSVRAYWSALPFTTASMGEAV